MVIEKGVPIPPPKTVEGSVRWTLNRLADAEVWDSVLIVGSTPERVRTAMSKVSKVRGVKFTSRKGREGVRVWRIG